MVSRQVLDIKNPIFYSIIISKQFSTTQSRVEKKNSGSGRSVGMIMVKFEDSFRRFKSPFGHFIQRKFSMKRKNSMIYALTTLTSRSQKK
jgi:hypothetical protein